MEKKAVAIIVGGGPAPGINGVICAATIEAINRGHKVYGVHTGFKRVMAGEKAAVQELTIERVSRIDREGGSMLGTSRANPRKDPKALETVVKTLNELNVGYLVTIGGDDTVSSARAVAQAAGGVMSVAHVPKTIDNDLPIPGHECTFGYHSAREVGTEIVETLLTDAKTTGRWYLVVAMGRKAGHLALGIGLSAGATLTLIPEDFQGREGKVPLGELTDIICGSIIKRLASGRPHGVAVLAEGLAELLDQSTIPELADAERDPHGHIRFAEVDFGGMIKRSVRARLNELGVKDLLAVDKNVGYELRCRPPVPFDREYTRELGFGVIDFLLGGGKDAMIIREGDRLRPLPFTEIIDAETGKSKVRMVDLGSITYLVAQKYMIRLKKSDLESAEFLSKVAAVTSISADQFKREFAAVAV
jgi:6-phosphofructokinase